MAAAQPNFFGNQFGSIYHIFFDVIGPRYENARQGMHIQLDEMTRELENFGYHLEGHLSPRLEFPNPPQAQYFPEFEQIYQILTDVRNQYYQAIENNDPNVPAMRNQLRDRLDNLELFIGERFLRYFLGRGEALAWGGGRRRKHRKSRKAKRKARKTRRR